MSKRKPLKKFTVEIRVDDEYNGPSDYWVYVTANNKLQARFEAIRLVKERALEIDVFTAPPGPMRVLTMFTGHLKSLMSYDKCFNPIKE